MNKLAWRRPLRVLVLLVVLLPAVPSPSVLAQEGEVPDLATLEAQYEDLFTNALDRPDTEPIFSLNAWGQVIMSAIMLDRRRAQELGTEPTANEEIQQRVLDRWRLARPGSPDPDLFLAIQMQEPEEKRAAVLALRDRFPDDYLVNFFAWDVQRRAGETAAATEILETYLTRNPDRPEVFRWLVQDARDNKTRQAEVLQRWARADPGDPRLVSAWMDSGLVRQEPESTAAVVDAFFAGRPGGADALRACRDVLRHGGPAHADAARACVARLAADPEPRVAEEATAELARLAAADGDWSGLMDSLDELPPEARWRAVSAAAGALQAPQRCGERVALLKSAIQALPPDAISSQSLSALLHRCADQPPAQDLFLSLLREVPVSELGGVVARWVSRARRGSQRYLRGDLPPESVGILEQRLQRHPDAALLYPALDVAYELAGAEEPRFQHLRRWRERAPSTFRGEQALALGRLLAARGEAGAAIEVLDDHLQGGAAREVAELTWGLHAQEGGPQQAAEFSARLIASGEPLKVSVGHLLAARGALWQGDRDTARDHFRQALAGEQPARDVAVELLASLHGGDDTADVAATALGLCRDTALAARETDVSRCAVLLLERAGLEDAAIAVLSPSGDHLPDDLEALRTLAQAASEGGDAELAERALRRALELDPRSARSWTDFGSFLETQGRTEELVDILERSRQVLGAPERSLYRAAGRALTAAGRPRKAIDVLREARATLPAGSRGDYGRAWIDHELRQAYRALGNRLPAPTAASDPAPSRTTRPDPAPDLPDAGAEELRSAADALYSGSGGRYDPVAAARLYRRAADLGDPRATFRLALLARQSPDVVPPDSEDAATLHRRSADAVAALAADGDGHARYLLGTAALSGLGGAEDHSAARRWLEMAAAQGEPWALHNLALMQETGRGFRPADPAAALARYRRAAEAGNAVSMYDFARLALTPSGPRELCDEALDWLRQAASTGNARAVVLLGRVLLYGRGDCVPADADSALPWLQAARDTGQPGAASDVAIASLRGLLEAEEAGEQLRHGAVSLLHEAAAEPNAFAVEILALLYATGIGVERDVAATGRLRAEAARLGSDAFERLRNTVRQSDAVAPLVEAVIARLTALAEDGDPPAAALLARLQQVGLGGDAEPRTTVALARRAAAAGEALAMRVLGDAYRQGLGVEESDTMARRWRRSCAEAGDSFCMLFLGQALRDGDGVERDLDGAVTWLHRAADSGNWWAVATYAHLLATGVPGLPADPDAAALWKGRLAALGDAEARGWLAYHGY